MNGSTIPVPAGTQPPARTRFDPSVAFGAGRRPEDATQVRLSDWEGPLGLLLTLIEARRLDILTVPLGALAGAYLEALAVLDGDRITNVSAFVAVASQLILIKSRAILPRRPEPDGPAELADEGPDPESELRRRLLLYRAYRDAGTMLQEGAGRWVGLFRREPGAAHAAAAAGARAPEAPPLDPMELVAALERLATVIAPPEPRPEVIRRLVTLNERAAIIRAALRNAPTVVLQELLSDVRDRVVIAVTFLARLELVKRREIVVEQRVPFGPIVARRTTRAERTAAGLDGGTEEDPLDESLASFR